MESIRGPAGVHKPTADTVVTGRTLIPPPEVVYEAVIHEEGGIKGRPL